MNRISLAPAVLLAAVCAVPARAQTHPWSMAAQMRVQMQWQRQSLIHDRALLQMEMRSARQQLAEQKRLARALTPHLPRRTSLPRPRTKPTHLVTHLHNLTTRLPALAHGTSTASIRVRPPSQATKNTPLVQIRISVSLNAGRGAASLQSGSALSLKRPSNALNRFLSKSGSLSARRSSLAPMPNMPGQPMFPPPPIAPFDALFPAVALSPTQGQVPPAPNPVPPPPALTGKAARPPAAFPLLLPPSLVHMHKVPALMVESKPWLPDVLRQEETTSFFLDSISAPSESLAKPASKPESGVRQLLVAIAKGGRCHPAQPETTAIQPDLVRQKPSLPPLQPRYPVTPLVAFE